MGGKKNSIIPIYLNIFRFFLNYNLINMFLFINNDNNNHYYINNNNDDNNKLII